MLREELRAVLNIEPKIFGNLAESLKDIVLDKEVVRLAAFSAPLSQIDETLKTKIIELLEKSGFQPPSKKRSASL